MAQQIEQEVVQQQLNPDGSMAPNRVATITADPRREVVAGSVDPWLTSFIGTLRTLPFPVDDLEISFGQDIYRRMAWTPSIAAAVRILRLSILSQEVTLHPAKGIGGDDPQQVMVLDFCESNLNGMEQSIKSVLFKWLDCLEESYTIAEVVYTDATTETDYKLRLKNIKTKMQGTVAFVVDPWFNTIGYVAVRAIGQGGMVMPALTGDAEDLPGLLPADKFASVTFYPNKEDPRGSAALRPLYTFWWLEMQAVGEATEALLTVTTPGLVGIAGEGAKPRQRQNPETGEYLFYPNGEPVMDFPQDVIVKALEAYRNRGCIGLPAGSSVDALQIQGTMEAYCEVMDFCDKQNTQGLLGTTRATREAEHGSRADSAQGDDVLSMTVAWGAFQLESALQQVLRNLLQLNFGPDMAATYCPQVQLGGESSDFAHNALGVSSLTKVGYWTEEQLPWVDAHLLGAPARIAGTPRIQASRSTAPAESDGEEDSDGDNDEEQ